MYANFFGLRCLPFEDRADPQFTVLSAELEETLAALEYEAHYQRGMALVTGAAGVGKTQMIRALLLRLHSTDHVVVVTRNANASSDLIRDICKGFGVSLASGEQETRLTTRLRRHLSRNAKADHSSVLIIDNAENLTDAEIELLSSLNDLCDNTIKLLTVVLVGQPRILDTLEQPKLERIKQKLFRHRTIMALPPAGIHSYIRHRLQIAGAAESDIFTDDAVTSIHRITGGVPRLINQTCNAALIAAYGSNERLVTSATIIDVTGGHTGADPRSPSVREPRTPTSDDVPTEPEHADVAPPAGAPFAAPPAWSDDVARSHPITEHPVTEKQIAEPHDVLASGYAEFADGGYTGTLASEDYDAQSRLERSLAQAERLSATTDAKLTQFTAIERHLATLAESAERLIAGLTQTTEHANRSFAQTQQRMEAVLAHSERRINDIDARVTQAVEVSKNLTELLSAVEAESERAEDVSTRLGAFADQLDHSVDEMQTRTAPLLEAVQSAQEFHDRLDSAHDKADHITERIEATIAKHEEAFAQRVSDTQAQITQSTNETIDKAKAEMDTALASVKKVVSSTLQMAENRSRLASNTLNKVMESSQARRTEIEEAANTVIEAISNASLQVGHLSETAKTIGAEADGLIERVRGLPAITTPMIEAAESTVTKIEQAHRDAEALRVSVTDRLVDLGRACEQTESLSRSVNSCKGTIDHILRNRDWIENTVTTLDEKVQRADDCVKALTAHDKHLGDIKETIAAAETTTAHLETATAGAKQIADRTNAIQQKLAEMLGSSNGQLNRIFETVRTGSAVAEDLTHLNKVAKELHEALQGLVAHTDEKIGRLDSHSAAAGRILRDLSEANKLGQGLIEEATAQVKTSQETAEASVKKIETLTEDVWSLTTKTDAVQSQLAEQLNDANDIVDKIRTLSDPARDAAGKLAAQVNEAQQVTLTLADHTSAAHEQLDAIDDITPLLEAVRDADDSIRSTASEIQVVRSELANALHDAQKQAATLDSLNSSAGTLIETQCQMAERMVDMSQTFDDKIVDTKTALATGEELLGEFINQGDAINKKLTGLATQAENLESSIDHITAKRDTVLKNAEAQTAHLEKLCVAVRKVFAGVSKATLEARDQTERLRQAEGSSSEQLAALTTRTQQATATLQEWVEEAVRVQTRLERAVGAAPTIQQTHPKETLAGLGNVVSASTQSVRTLDADLAMQNKSGGAAASPLATPNPTPKPKNIEQMIEEAKRAKAHPG